MNNRFKHAMPFGAELTDAGVRFRLWAPGETAVGLQIEYGSQSQAFVMEARDNGWFELSLSRDFAGPGTQYRYCLGGGMSVPDPASRFQPKGVNGASMVIDPTAYNWNYAEWVGRPWEEAVLYELHTGCFSDVGTFDGIRRYFDHLMDIGITAIELMPVAEFDGARNWGYDGVLPFAPHADYGKPDDLKRLIDEAHGRGLMVFLDVVYNHFGPSGNYLHRYAPAFFTERHITPWGAAINFDDHGNRTVRDFFVHNALYWIEEFRFDGLRFDAVHAIHDDSARHILTEIAEEIRSRVDGKRHVHLVLENDDNAARYLARATAGSRRYDAQWNDDFHHVAHVILTGETDGYYGDYAEASVAMLGRILTEGFAYQGEKSPFREGRHRGENSFTLPPTAFVSFLQNHDQVGNRAFGERVGMLAPREAMQVLHAVLLLSPQIPMLFMGEEWDAQRPFQFFCDFDGDLAKAVRDGRRQEFAGFPRFSAPESLESIPDPNTEQTFLRSRLAWEEIESPEHAEYLTFIRKLLDLRGRYVVPFLKNASSIGATYEVEGNALLVHWYLGDNRLHLIANFSDDPVEGLAWFVPGTEILRLPVSEPANERCDRLSPWTLVVSIETAVSMS
jgi:malto-oligosyltrehalose trehalohydrolase